MEHVFTETTIKNLNGLVVFRCPKCSLRTCYPDKEEDKECIPHNRSKFLNELYIKGNGRGKWGRYYKDLK